MVWICLTFAYALFLQAATKKSYVDNYSKSPRYVQIVVQIAKKSSNEISTNFYQCKAYLFFLSQLLFVLPWTATADYEP